MDRYQVEAEIVLKIVDFFAQSGYSLTDARRTLRHVGEVMERQIVRGADSDTVKKVVESARVG